MQPAPHGGKLIHRVLSRDKREKILSQQSEFKAIQIDDETASDAANIAQGVFSPLEGFLCEDDFKSVLDNKRMADDLPWTIPIILDISEEEASGISEGEEVLLRKEEFPIAVLSVEEKYRYSKKELAAKVYGTLDTAHPGVAKTNSMGEVLLGGRIALIQPPPTPFSDHFLTPQETRRVFAEKGWKTVVGFQTRNVPHIGHEYVQKTALTFTDGLFINPVIGRKKKGDFRDEVILESYNALIEHYYPQDRVFMSILQTEMRYAGPREAIFHAVVRKNFGCTHFIVGRDHAGVGSYYHPYAAHEIFAEFDDLGITPMFFKSFYYCNKCKGYTNEKVCPHGEEYRVNFSGTRMRELIEKGEMPPVDSMRPEVSSVILKYEHPFV
jgi:sulfate adenylyltransferase